MAVPLSAIGAGLTCLTGTVRRQAPVGIPLPGNFVLRSGGQTIAALVDAGAGLGRFVGQRATVCGLPGGEVEGVPVLRATAAFPAAVPRPPAIFPPLNFQVRCFLVPTGFGFGRGAFGAGIG